MKKTSHVVFKVRDKMPSKLHCTKLWTRKI